MTKSRTRAQLSFRPAVAVAGLSVLGVIMLSAMHEVSAPDVDAREAGDPQDSAVISEPSAPGVNHATGMEPLDQVLAKPVRVAEAQTTSSTTATDATGQQFGDIVLGDPDAPVTVIEYASMTCSHCAAFHANTLPKLKEQYIEAGKVKYVLREFPLDNLAAAASLLARCVSEDKYYPFVDMLFEKQSQWARADDPLKELRQVAKVAGFTEAKFNACLRDQQALDYIQQVRNSGNQKYDIRSTPTLIVNGQKLEGNQSITTLQGVIDPMLDDAKEG